MTGVLTDEESSLLARLRASRAERERAFAELFARYRGRVFTICRHLTRTQADAEDATQEVFVALMRALPKFRGEAALGTFVHRIAVRVGLQQRKRAARGGEPTPVDDTRTTEDRDPVEARQAREKLWRALEQLTAEQQTVLALFAVDELSHGEIAAILGVAEGTVWSRVHRARKQLVALLA